MSGKSSLKRLTDQRVFLGIKPGFWLLDVQFPVVQFAIVYFFIEADNQQQENGKLF